MIRKSGHPVFPKRSCSKRSSSALQEKNAIFSAWLMRRIGANGSGADALGRCRIPLARSVEPSDGPGNSRTAGSTEIGGAGSGKGLGVEGHEGGSVAG